MEIELSDIRNLPDKKNSINHPKKNSPFIQNSEEKLNNLTSKISKTCLNKLYILNKKKNNLPTNFYEELVNAEYLFLLDTDLEKYIHIAEKLIVFNKFFFYNF